MGFEPIYIGIYTVSYALAGIVVSQKFGAMADRGADSKRLFLWSLIGIILTALSYAFFTQFWQILIAGTVFMGLARASVPMILTMIRHYSDRSGLDSTKVNAQLRSSVSLIWIVGPPIAFYSVDTLGFQLNFLLAAALTSLLLIYAWKSLPSSNKRKVGNEETPLVSSAMPRSVIYLGVVLLFANIANSNYITAMPLYLTSELAMPLAYPGVLLGLTAACEVPIMLMAARWARSIGAVRLLMLSFVMAMIFYALCQWVVSIEGFLLIQVFNGLFFGIFVGIGISLLQNEAPNAIGKATAFYANMMALGSMAGASLMGIVAQYFGYKEALLLSFVAILIGFLMLLMFEFSSKRHRGTEEVSEVSGGSEV